MAARQPTKPVLLLVSGAPGSGKTTLAERLATVLALPHLNKDAIRDAMRFTFVTASTHEDHVWAALYTTLETWLGRGISAVTDFTTYRGRTDVELSRRITPLADLITVHCRAEGALDRFAVRIADHPHFAPDSLRVAEGRAQAQATWGETAVPLNLGRPTLEVDTTAGYSPDLAEITAWVLEQSGRRLPLRADLRSGR